MDLVVRAKKKSDGEWVKGYIWRGSNAAVIIPYNIGVDIDVKKNSLQAWAVEVDPSTISRYTCREDSKGHFLVEYQIVEAQTCDGKVRGVLIYNERRGAWEVQVSHKGTDIMQVYDLISCVQIVAIGNIFDNAQLLDDTEGDVSSETAQQEQEDTESKDSMQHEEPYVAPCGTAWTEGAASNIAELLEVFEGGPISGIVVIERRHK